MTKFIALVPLLLAGTAALAAEPLQPRAGTFPETGRLLQDPMPRSTHPIDLPPMSDAFRCEPVTRIDNGTPVAFREDSERSGVDGGQVQKFCER